MAPKSLLRNAHLFFLLFISIQASGAYGDNGTKLFRVKYMSSANIYVDGGAADSVAVGDSLKVVRGDSLIAVLEVSYTAQHSASCKVIERFADIQVGDIVQAKIKAAAENPPQKTPEEISAQQDDLRQAIRPVEKPESKPTRISGRASINYFAWHGFKNNDLDFKRPGFELRLTARDLWGSGYSLNVRTSTRYNQREKRYSNDVAQNEFRNRIYEFSLGNENDEGLGFRFGRIIPRDMSGIGYIDGFMVSRKSSDAFRIGGFGGAQPEWQYASFQTSLQKYGLFISRVPDRGKGMRLESTLAMVGEYHSSDISREFIHIRNLLENERGFNIYQSADIDINRSWRHDKAKELIALTSFYVSARYRFGPRINAMISFDSRKGYWNYDQKSIADSLFDDLSRRGLRATLDVRLPANFGVVTNFGLRNSERFSETASSYSINVSKGNFTKAKIRLDIGAAGFTGQYSDGLRLSYDLGKYFRHGDYLGIGYGLYRYTYKSIDAVRSSRWFEGRWIVRLSDKIMFSGELQRSMGDDIEGLTVMGDIGYSFR